VLEVPGLVSDGLCHGPPGNIFEEVLEHRHGFSVVPASLAVVLILVDGKDGHSEANLVPVQVQNLVFAVPCHPLSPEDTSPQAGEEPHLAFVEYLLLMLEIGHHLLYHLENVEQNHYLMRAERVLLEDHILVDDTSSFVSEISPLLDLLDRDLPL